MLSLFCFFITNQPNFYFKKLSLKKINMKRIIFGVFSFFSVFMLAQNQRFIYEYKFVTDSTDKSKTDQEIMYLDIAKKGSKFYSQKRFAADSIREDRIAKKMRDFTGID